MTTTTGLCHVVGFVQGPSTHHEAMMLQIPKYTRMTIRRTSDELLSMFSFLNANQRADMRRVVIEVVCNLEITRNTVHVVNFATGYEGDRYGTRCGLQSGVAGVTVSYPRRGLKATGHVYVSDFTESQEERDVLSVARDVVLSDGSLREAHKIASSVIPYGAGLFVTMCQLEQKFLKDAGQ